MNVGAPFWLEVWWNNGICIPLAVPFCVAVEPVDQLSADLALRARLVVGYCIHRARFAFCTPGGSRIHTAHCFV